MRERKNDRPEQNVGDEHGRFFKEGWGRARIKPIHPHGEGDPHQPHTECEVNGCQRRDGPIFFSHP